MLDNFRDDPADYVFEEDSDDFLFPEDGISDPPKKTKGNLFRLDVKEDGRFLGMTAPQRLIIAIMLMFAVFSLGAMCLLITGKITFY